MKLRSCIVVMLIAGSFCIVSGQDITGNLEGRALDASGTPIPGVTVSVKGASLQGQRGISSDREGFFRLLGLPSGRYAVQLRHIAYQQKTLNEVQVLLGKTTTIGDVALQDSAVGMQEVVISGERPLLDPTSTTSGGNLVRENFEDLPLERNYRNIASILPNANQSYYGDEINMGGATGIENQYYINGTDVTEPINGAGGINLPYNFIREVQVKTGGYEPEYKSSLGGIMNVVTYTGGNGFSGHVFGFYTNNNFGGEPRLAESEPPTGAFSQYDVGFTLGGPILYDRLWFFVAYSPYFRNEDIRLPGLGYYPDKLETHSFAGKLTWKAGDDLDLGLTLMGDPSTWQAVGQGWPIAVLNATNPDPLLSEITRSSYGLLIDAHHVSGRSLIVDGSLSVVKSRDKSAPSPSSTTSEAMFFDFATSTIAGGTWSLVDNQSNTVSGKFSVSWLPDNHELKLGVEYKEISENSVGRGAFVGKYDDTTYVSSYTSVDGTVKNRIPSAYLQDSWSPIKELRITGGLRWDGLFLIGSNDRVAARILGQYQPRLGVVYTPGGDETRKIFASAGRFSEDLLMRGPLTYFNATQLNTYLFHNHDPRLDPAGDTIASYSGHIPPDVQDLSGQYYDEASLGYEQLLTRDLKITTVGRYRKLREVVEDSEYPPGSGEFILGNPGHDPLTAYPSPQRDYLSLEVVIEKSWSDKLNLLASYVLSRSYGNYVGGFVQDLGGLAMANVSPAFDKVDLFTNATGLLPNDRTHMFKLNASYRLDAGLTCAASFLLGSGTPLSEYARRLDGYEIHLVPRGSAGRLPAVWDLNLRFTYTVPFWTANQIRPRLVLDLFHIASQKQAVAQDQYHYYGVDENGNPIYPNENYGEPTKFQPPMSVRLGMEVNF